MIYKNHIDAYFYAEKGDINLIEKYFDADVVIDDTGEGEVIRGIEESKKWLKDKIKKYNLQREIIDIKEDKKTVNVSTKVTGDFAKGVFLFEYIFIFSNDKIKKIKIVFVGEE
ncbi:MAG: hypothetical protein ACK5LP_00675 [Campylobacteraceae bacterium]